jgi:predicted SPOUT superfamily RNA methylase MTH1
MAKNLPQPNWNNYPATVAQLTPKQLWQITRMAIQYEAQESSDIEAPTWQGALWGALCSLLSDESRPPYNRHTVYQQQINTAYTGCVSALDGAPDEPEAA